MPSQVFNRHYWSARELVVLGVFSAAAKLSTLLVALVGGGMNPVSLLAKNLIFTTLLVVMLYKVRKPGTLALFVLVNMLISMLLLGGSVTLLPAMLLAAGCAEAAMACSGGMRCSASRCTISRRKFFRWAFRGCSCVRVRPCCMSSFPLWSSATWDRCAGFFPASAPFGSCVMQALSVTEGSGCGGGLHAADTRAKMFVSLLASVATVALSGVEPQMVLFGMSLVYALGMRQFRILLIGYAVLVGMSLLAMGCAFGMSLLIPSMPAFSAVSLVVPFLRMATMLNVILPLAFSCRVQSLLTALKSLRLPFCLYLPAAVMIRFIPTFLHDAKQVSETLRIRGWRMTPWNAFRYPVLLIRLVFTPLLFRSLKTSEELGIAAELKGLGYGEGMRPYRKLVWKASDTWLLVAACLVAAAAVLCQHAVGWAPLEGGMR